MLLLKKPLESTIAPKVHLFPPFVAVIDAPLFMKDRTYIPEPPMEDGRRNLWYHASLIPYSIAGTFHAFMGRLLRFIEKPQMLEDFFPTFHSFESLVFVDNPFDFKFFKNIVSCSSPPTEDVDYIK